MKRIGLLLLSFVGGLWAQFFTVVPNSLQFGNVPVGTSVAQTFRVQNTLQGDFPISYSVGSNNTAYAVNPPANFQIPGANQFHDVTVTFTPPSVGGPFSATITVTGFAPQLPPQGVPMSVSASGNG